MENQIYKDHFGIIFSIGSACKPAFHLKRNGLRPFAAPLDYQMGYSLKTVLHLFKTQFEDFFLNVEEDSKGGAEGKRKVIDSMNHIISLHHFPKDCTLDAAQAVFRQKMKLRYVRLNDAINRTESFAMICDRSDGMEKMQMFLLDFSAIYPDKKITLFVMRNRIDMDDIKMAEYNINDSLKIIEYQFLDYNPKTYYGNENAWKTILSGIKIE